MRLSGRFTSPVMLRNKGRRVPNNTGFGTIAQKAVDTLSTVMAQRSNNSMALDGWPVYIHRWRNGGIVCTCKTKAPSAEDPYDTNLRVTEDLNSELPGHPPFTAPAMKMRVQLRGDGVEDNPKINRSDMQSMNVNKNTLDTLFDTDVDNFPEEPLDIATSLASYATMDDKPCGICAGTGFIDTYQWVSGLRFILIPETAEFDQNTTVNTDTRPHSFDVEGANSVYWTIQVPAYFVGLEIWRVRDNIDLAPELRLTVDLTGTGDGPWNPLTVNAFDSLMGVGGAVIVRAQATNAAIDDISMFTHVEIYLKTSELPFCQFPQLDRDINGSTLEALLNVSYELEPRIGGIPRQSIIESPGHARLWFVTQASNKQTAKGFVFNVSGTVQVVQPNMPMYSLSFFPRWQGKNLTSFTAVETKATAGFPHTKIRPTDEDSYANGSRQSK
jgi:hypothetical protein